MRRILVLVLSGLAIAVVIGVILQPDDEPGQIVVHEPTQPSEITGRAVMPDREEVATETTEISEVEQEQPMALISGKPPTRLFHVGSERQRQGDHQLVVWQPELVINANVGLVVDSLRVMFEGEDVSERFQSGLMEGTNIRVGAIAMPELMQPGHYAMSFSFVTLPESEWEGAGYRYELEVERLSQAPYEEPPPMFGGFPSSPPPAPPR